MLFSVDNGEEAYDAATRSYVRWISFDRAGTSPLVWRFAIASRIYCACSVWSRITFATRPRCTSSVRSRCARPCSAPRRSAPQTLRQRGADQAPAARSRLSDDQHRLRDSRRVARLVNEDAICVMFQDRSCSAASSSRISTASPCVCRHPTVSSVFLREGRTRSAVAPLCQVFVRL